MSTHGVAGLRAAWTFLTRVPLGAGPPDAGADTMAFAPAWFAVIGACIGAIVGGVYCASYELVGPSVGAALAVTAGALLTGAFHQDGLADMSDAFGGGWTVDQRLEILKDSRHGTYGVMSLVCVIAVQISALAQHDRPQGFAIAVTAHAGARGGAVVLMRFAPRARGAGLGVDYARGLTTATALASALTAAAIGALALGALVSVTTAAVAVMIALMALLAWRKVGGITGDVLGAAEQLAETAVLVCGAAFARHVDAWPWWR